MYELRMGFQGCESCVFRSRVTPVVVVQSRSSQEPTARLRLHRSSQRKIKKLNLSPPRQVDSGSSAR